MSNCIEPKRRHLLRASTKAAQEQDAKRSIVVESMELDAMASCKRSAGPSLILWDLVGSCNLKCPSCPMGSMRSLSVKGFIGDELFEAVLTRLHRSFACRQLHFYNWTEPLLHPRIAEFSRRAADLGFHVHLSSNLNHLPHPEALMSAGAKTFRISLSGFTNDVYRVGHRGGSIERVKHNMQRLAKAHRTVESRTRVHVYFHKYRHNVHELEAAEMYAREFGFEFQSDWAFLMPLEKILAYTQGTISEAERAFADAHFAPRLDDAFDLVRSHGGCNRPCSLIEQLVLNHQGQALLCCGSFDPDQNVIGSFLDVDWETLQARRYAHSMCGPCMEAGAHAFCTNVSDPTLRAKMNELAEATVGRRMSSPGDRLAISLPILNDAPVAMSRSA